MIGVILPSRGLVFAEALESLERNLTKYDHRIYYSYDLPIPECENVLVEKALHDGCEYLLFIEEDTVIPIEGLDEMIRLNSDIACIDYGVQGWGCVTRDKTTNEILWCGLGCTLIKRKVFEKLETPYFRSDKQLLLNFWPEMRWIDAPANSYGGQDIWFCTHAQAQGFVIKQVDGMECKHLKLDSLGVSEINKGLHKISQKPTINKRQTL